MTIGVERVSPFVEDFMAAVKAKNPAEPEFHQAVFEVAQSVGIAREQDVAGPRVNREG